MRIKAQVEGRKNWGQGCPPDIPPLGVVAGGRVVRWWAGTWLLPCLSPRPLPPLHKAPFTRTTSVGLCSCSGGLGNPVKKTNSSWALGWRALLGTEAGFFSPGRWPEAVSQKTGPRGGPAPPPLSPVRLCLHCSIEARSGHLGKFGQLPVLQGPYLYKGEGCGLTDTLLKCSAWGLKHSK